MNTSKGPGKGKIRRIARVWCADDQLRKSMLIVLKGLGFSCDAPDYNERLMLIQAYNGKLLTQWMTERDFEEEDDIPLLYGTDIVTTNGDNVCAELEKLKGIDLPIKRMETVDVTRHTTPGIFILNMVSTETKREDLLALYEPMGGAVTVELKINGIVMPFAKSIVEMWDRLNRHNDELAMEKALKMVSDAGMDDIVEMMSEFKSEMRDTLRRKFPNINLHEEF